MSELRLNVSASLWSADLGDLRAHMMRAEPYCDSFHFDVMDGHYVPNLLFGPDQIRSLRTASRKPFEIHLMIADPGSMLDLFLDSGDVFIFHRETCRDLSALSTRVRERGKRIGLALKVEDDWRALADDLPLVEVVLIMGTAIGIKGASLQSATYATIRQLKDHARASGLRFAIQADGGIRRDTVPLLRQAGADAVTVGSLLFGPGQSYDEFRSWILSIAG